MGANRHHHCHFQQSTGITQRRSIGDQQELQEAYLNGELQAQRMRVLEAQQIAVIASAPADCIAGRHRPSSPAGRAGCCIGSFLTGPVTKGISGGKDRSPHGAAPAALAALLAEWPTG